jgi:hypothetical protein
MGFSVLDDALYFSGDTRRLQVVDVPMAEGLAEGEAKTIRLQVKAGTALKAVLVWTDPAGHIAPCPTPHRSSSTISTCASPRPPERHSATAARPTG